MWIDVQGDILQIRAGGTFTLGILIGLGKLRRRACFHANDYDCASFMADEMPCRMNTFAYALGNTLA